MSAFRDFAKKAFNATKSFFKETAKHVHVAPVGKVVEPRQSKQSRQIDAGMRKIEEFILRGIILNPVPKRKPRDRSGVKLCTNHQPKTRRLYRKLWSGGTYEYRIHGALRT